MAAVFDEREVVHGARGRERAAALTSKFPKPPALVVSLTRRVPALTSVPPKCSSLP
jgi:hypothetical protein